MSKKMKCQNCGREITLGIKEEELDSPECCGQPMIEVQVGSCRNAGPEASRPMVAEEPCNDFTGHDN